MDSRELDRKVAEALGWTDFPVDLNGYPYARDRKGTLRFAGFQIDIAAAIGALEEFCNGHKYEWTLENDINEQKIYCRIWTDTKAKSLGSAATIPLAICHAIVAAAKHEGVG